MSEHMSNLDAPALELLVAGAHQHLEALGYTPDILSRFRAAWRAFLHWFASIGESAGRASIVELTDAYLASVGIVRAVPDRDLRAHQRHIRRATAMLTEYAIHGSIHRRRLLREKVPLAVDLALRLAGAGRYWKDQIKASTLRARMRDVTGFLAFLMSRGATTVGDIRASVLSEFAASRSQLRPESLARELSHTRAFLRYLADRQLIPPDLVRALPRVRVRKHGRIPSVWRQDDVAALLAAVDRGSPVGKRDYAILLLAARLGMRASDIRCLRLEHLRWDEARIEFDQRKTGRRQSLPLFEEIGCALIDYLRHGRPPSEHREVFLKVHAPIEPFPEDSTALYAIITKYRRVAGIQLTPRTRAGLHALRHTLASRLLELDTPLEHISAVMGHVDPETTRLYTKVDIKALREVALNPEELPHA